MKRFLALLLCLGLLLCGMTACKPDNISDPAGVTDPSKNPSQDGSSDSGDSSNSITPLTVNPLAAEDFIPSTGVESALTASGFTQVTDPATALKEKTITLYTAGEDPAFSYVNQEGEVVSEWDWMKAYAESQGFLLKLTIKSEDLSLKTQRVAVYSGKKISLLQLSEKDLAEGMTIARSAKNYLNTNEQTFGISKAVLNQSNHTLFAPVGQVKSLWYNTALVDSTADPHTLSARSQWTLEEFKTNYNRAFDQSAMPLQMSDDLAWATLSGKSPLTLAEGKLDSNIGSKDTREVWKSLVALRSELPTFKKKSNTIYNIKNGNVAMAFIDAPALGKNIKLDYAPLPALTEGTAGTVVYSGSFLALPRMETTEEEDLAAIAFAEAWCNRYTEARAGALQTLGVTEKNYVNYINMAEGCGMLIFRNPEIDAVIKPYLASLNNPEADMDKLYEDDIKDSLMALIDRHNLYY